MPLLRIAFAYGFLFSLSLFISANLESLFSGTGYLFLAIAVLCFVAMAMLSGNVSRFFLIKKSTIFMIAFIAYFGIKFFFESGDADETKQVLVGTSGGIVFALSIGFMCSYALSTIYELRFQIATSHLAFVAAFAFFIFAAFLSWSALNEHLGQVRSDLFLIEDQRGYYQRAGDLASILVIMVVTLATTMLASMQRIHLLTSALMLPLVLGIGGLLALMSQVIGSNSGLVASAGIIFVFLVNYYVMSSGGQQGYSSIYLSNLIFGPLAFRILIGSLIAGSLLAFTAVAAVRAFDIDVSMLRISGFGTGDISSVESRSEIFEQNFIRHLEYSPIFGNTQVERLTTGEGTYAHSLLALFSHVGFFGAGLFFVAIFWIYTEIADARSPRGRVLYSSKRYGLFRIMMLGAVLAMCLYSAFFTWMPMWFAIGLYGDWYRRQ